MTEEKKKYAAKEAPLTVVTVFGEIGCGKTLFGINSPYKPVLVFDTERSSKLYTHLYDFTRRGFTGWGGEAGMKAALEALSAGQYGTIVIDTSTHLCEWMTKEAFRRASQIKFSSGKTRAEVQPQLVWSDAKQAVRDVIFTLFDKVQVIVLTAHSRNKWGATGIREARVLDPIHEVSDIVMQLVRKPNQQIPSGILGTDQTKSRLMALPPRLPQATWPVILDYITKKPANWDKLTPEELAPEVLYPIPTLEDEK